MYVCIKYINFIIAAELQFGAWEARLVNSHA